MTVGVTPQDPILTGALLGTTSVEVAVAQHLHELLHFTLSNPSSSLGMATAMKCHKCNAGGWGGTPATPSTASAMTLCLQGFTTLCPRPGGFWHSLLLPHGHCRHSCTLSFVF